MPNQTYFSKQIVATKLGFKPGGFVAYLEAALDQELVGEGTSLVTAELLAGLDSNAKFSHLSGSAARDMHHLINFFKALEHFCSKALRGRVDAMGMLIYMVLKAIAYLDKVTAQRPDLARPFAFDSFVWAVRLPAAPRQRGKVIKRLEELGVGGRFKEAGVNLGNSRFGLIGWFLPVYMSFLRTPGLDVKGIDFAEDCRALPPLQDKASLETWWELARKILRDNYAHLGKLISRELDSIRQYRHTEAEVYDRFVDLVRDEFKKFAFAAAKQGSAGQHLEVVDDEDLDVEPASVGAERLPDMLVGPTDPRIKAQEIRDPDGFIRKLVYHSDPVSQYLWTGLLPEEMRRLKAYSGNAQTAGDLRAFLADHLNVVLYGCSGADCVGSGGVERW